LSTIKASWANEFDQLTDFSKDEIKWWLVTFVDNNEDHLASIEKLHSEFEEIEEEIFMLRIKQDIIVATMKDYIDGWLKKSLAKIVIPK
jgi:hypothetical protein